MTGKSSALPATIPALQPRHGAGHQFVCYADCCSGVPGGRHEATFAAVNAVVARLRPRPEFICFPGDEISGLTADPEILRRQWHHWFRHEMAWLDRGRVPLYHTTGNHTTYDAASEAVFREVMSHLPQNGPSDQLGLSYFVRRDDLLLVFVNTLWSGLGGEGRVEVDWLEQTLSAHAGARYKLVIGHHPVHAVNGFSGAYQRELAPDNGRVFWQILVEQGVLAYWCSHILAFDVQVHAGVLQILTAGAGTAHRMPEGIEYLHCVQAALDADGLRYQVLDTTGRIREWLSWPLNLPSASTWHVWSDAYGDVPVFAREEDYDPAPVWLAAWHFQGRVAADGASQAQTLLCGWHPGQDLAPIWIGFQGQEQRLSIWLSPEPGRSPHLWLGPAFDPDEGLDLQIAIHSGMGPGGILWRRGDQSSWSSCKAASPWGAERLRWPSRWRLGADQYGWHGRPFRGQHLHARWYWRPLQLNQEA